MTAETEGEHRNLQLAEARWHAGVARGVLDAHRASAVHRGHQWKVEEALYLQQLEEAQSRLVYLTSIAFRFPGQSPRIASRPARVVKATARPARFRWARLLGLRRRQMPQKPSHEGETKF